MKLSLPSFKRASPHASPPPYAAEKSTWQDTHDASEGWAVPANEAPTLREWVRHKLDRILPRLAVPMGLLVGGGIFAGTTYALVVRVQWLMATATVSSDPNVWMQEARTKAYDVCYFSCTDNCNDVNYAWNACARTALANVTGIQCDGAKMWNWKDRYPLECLAAVGEFFKSDALDALRKSYRNQLAIIILTVLGGLVGGVVTHAVWSSCTEHRKTRALAWGNRFGAPKWPRIFTAPAWRTKRGNATTGGGRGRRARALATWFLALFAASRPGAGGVPGAAAYSCTGHDPVHDQYFVNGNRTLFGVVHGWFSNCYDVTVCTQSCSTSCSGGGGGGGGPFGSGGGGGMSCSTSCSPSCWTETYSDRAPAAYVGDVLPRVRDCGFALVDQVEGDVSLRVANAGIEKHWWLSIRVNGYNVTDVRDTDDAVLCLHAIGEAKP